MDYKKDGIKRTDFHPVQDLAGDPAGQKQAGELVEAIRLKLREDLLKRIADAADLPPDIKKVTVEYFMALSKNEPYDLGDAFVPVGKFFTVARTVKMTKMEEEQFELVRLSLRKTF